MGEKSIEERVETLEKDMDSLRALPAKVDHLGKEVENLALRVSGVESQISQLRTDMTGEFSAIRGEMNGMKDELREDIAALGRDTAAQILESRNHTKMLFQEHIGRRAVIGEGNPMPDLPSGA